MSKDHHLSKCLLVTTHYRPLVGGAQMVYDALASAVPQRFTVLTSQKDYTSGREVPNWRAFDSQASYQIERLPKVRPNLKEGNVSLASRLALHLDAWKIRRDLKRTIKQNLREGHYDAICIGAIDALGYLLPWIRKNFSIPVILYTHGEEICQQAFNDRAEKRRRAVLQGADGIVAVSSFTKKIIAEKYGVAAAKIETITNGVDIQRFSTPTHECVRKDLGIGEGPLVVAVGRLVARKGFDKLIHSWVRVKDAVSTGSMVIGGVGPMEGPLREMIEKKGLEDSVQLLGMVPDDLLPSLYAAADLFAMPNRTMPDGDTEGFGLVFLEAAAAGTPAVGGKAGGVPDAIIDHRTGVLVDGENEAEIAKEIIGLLNDDKRRAAMGKAAREHDMTQGWDAKAQQFLDFVDRLTEERKEA